MSALYYYAEDVVWLEVPGETSLAFTISGCPVGCKGCHSVQSWPAQAGLLLTPAVLLEKIQKYQGLISCVLFLGGEWQPALLAELLILCQQQRLKTCLYTGLITPPPSLVPLLDFVKTGPWVAELGPLGSPGSNQRFYDLNKQQDLTWMFLPADLASPAQKQNQQLTQVRIHAAALPEFPTPQSLLKEEGSLPCNDS